MLVEYGEEDGEQGQGSPVDENKGVCVAFGMALIRSRHHR